MENIVRELMRPRGTSKMAAGALKDKSHPFLAMRGRFLL